MATVPCTTDLKETMYLAPPAWGHLPGSLWAFPSHLASHRLRPPPSDFPSFSRSQATSTIIKMRQIINTPQLTVRQVDRALKHALLYPSYHWRDVSASLPGTGTGQNGP